MLWRELCYAFRQLQKSPGFTILAVLTLAFGIGASTAVFTLVDSVILQPLSYRDSGRLSVVWERVRFLGIPYVGANPRHVDVWQKRATAFENLTLVQERTSGVSIGMEHPQVMGTVRAYPNLLDVLQVKPILGRGFRPEDGVRGHENVAILTYGLWQTLFHGDPNAIGKTLRVADVPRVIVGVLPRSFHFPNANALSSMSSTQAADSALAPELIVPVALDLNRFDWNGEYGNWIALARLKPGVTPKQAEAQLNTLEAQIVEQMPADQRDNEPNALLSYVQPMQEAVVHSSKLELWLLMAAVLGLMLIACVNLANAQLGRALTREREAAVRSALGASGWQLLACSLLESVLLALAGGVGGILLASEALDLFRRYTPIDLPRLAEVHPNAAVLVFALVLMCGCALLFGVLPAAHFVRANPQQALQQNSARTAGSRENRNLRRWLIGLEVFGSAALLLIMGLFARSLFHLLQSDKGFDSAQIVAAEVDLSGAAYRADQTKRNFDDGVLRSLRAIPGVESSALVSAMPLEGETWIDGITRSDKPMAKPPLANFRWISPGYFQTIRERLVAGRLFDDRDAKQKTVIISQASARAAWPGENPIGRKIRHNGQDYTVVGIVADARNNSLKLAPANMVYFDFHDDAPYSSVFLVRSRLRSDQLIPAVRRAIWSQGPDAVISRIKTLDSQLADSLAPERFETAVLTGFGAAALLLAMLGVYGVLSYTVAARRQEIGVRMALGATRESIYRLTMREAFLPVAAGLAAGWLLSVALARLVRSLLYGVSTIDATVSLAVICLFLLAAAIAAFVPARRAASIDPMEALRTE
jgi:predicted permease